MTPSLEVAVAVPTGVGSLPLSEPEAAARLVLDLLPELPAAPQLPRRTPLEGMLGQVAHQLPGVVVRPDGSLSVVGPLGPPEPHLDDAAWAGTLAFLAAVRGRRTPVKLQVAGPVTVGLALVAGGARDEGSAFRAAGEAVRARIDALRGEAARRCPGTPLVIVLDEPGLSSFSHPGFPLPPDETIDLLSSALSAAGPETPAGIHCCGPTDWSLALHAGPSLVSVPVDVVTPDDAAALSTFLERGGRVVWGVVPTDGPIGERETAYWRRLAELWCELSRHGCDPMLLRSQSLLSPACGLALHRVDQVRRVFSLVRRVAERVQDQVMATRLSAGA